jgi:hypothetical protein
VTALSLGEVADGMRLLAALPFYLRQPLIPEHARALLQRRFAARERDFLTLVRTVVYAAPASVYRHLLRHAGCEYGDVGRAVTQDGVDGALRSLLRHGAYLTIDELKGRCPVVRGA